MSLKGFSATYVAIEVAERRENIEASSHENVTPFPGSLKSIYANKNSNGDDDSNGKEYNQHEAYNLFQRNSKRIKSKMH